MSMAEPKTQQENEMFTLAAHLHDAWVPATDEETEGSFKWPDGTTLATAGQQQNNGTWLPPWGDGEPNNWNNEEDCVVKSGGKWNDIACSYNYGYVCVTAELTPPVCADFSDTCTQLFLDDPAVCRTHSPFATRICPLTCGKCHSDTKVKVTCDTPAIPANAFSVTSQSSGKMAVGDYVQHRCDAGYLLKRGDTVRGCLVDGTVSGEAMECEESCPKRRQDGWHFDLTAQKCYGYFNSPVNLDQATTACTEIGMSIALPKSENVNDILRSLTQGDLMVPLTDREKEGTFKWVDGTVLGWANWQAGGEPNDWYGEDCTIMVGSGEWNDRDCGVVPGYVCEAPVITPPVCEDLSSSCAASLVADPTMCGKDKLFDEQQCALTCGVCAPLTGVTTCDVPAVPASASHVSGPASGTMQPGQFVEHRCDAGLMVEKGNAVRACLPDGTLTGEEISCIGSCPTGWVYSGFDSKLCYFHVIKAVNYWEGKKACEDLLGTLATPKTAEEQQKINFLMQKAPWWTWIGLDDVDTEGQFTYADGASLDANSNNWSNWNSGEPNNMFGAEDCVVTAPVQGWEDRSCSDKAIAVCQVPLSEVSNTPLQPCYPGYGYHSC